MSAEKLPNIVNISPIVTPPVIAPLPGAISFDPIIMPRIPPDIIEVATESEGLNPQLKLISMDNT